MENKGLYRAYNAMGRRLYDVSRGLEGLKGLDWVLLASWSLWGLEPGQMSTQVYAGV